MDHLGDGSLGVVTVEVGDAIQIRSLEAITGDVSFFGLPIDRATQIAVDDYGPIHGFDVDTGTSLDDLCSNDGGQAAAQQIVADEDVVGVIGTSCSGAAVAAAPLITDAGMVLISGGNTSPRAYVRPGRHGRTQLQRGLLPHRPQRPVPGRGHGQVRVQ